MHIWYKRTDIQTYVTDTGLIKKSPENRSEAVLKAGGFSIKLYKTTLKGKQVTL